MAKGGLKARILSGGGTPKPFNVILMREGGRIRQYRVYARTLRLLFIFMALFVGFSVVAINRYQVLYMENQDLREKITHLESRLTAGLEQETPPPPVEIDVERSYRLLAVEVDKADQASAAASGEGREPPAAMDAPSAEEKAPEAEPAPAKEETPAVEPAAKEEPINPLVDVSSLSLRPQNGNSSVRFKYRLSNIHPDSKPVSGYLFLVLYNGKTDPATLAPFPEVEFQGDHPTDFKKGTVFRINNLKDVEGVVSKLKDPENFDKALVMAYSEDGQLIMKKLVVSDNG